MTALLPPVDLPSEPVTLPVKALRHEWDHENEERLAAVEFSDGNGRTFKTCKRCRLVKITVHPPFGTCWNEWRHPNGATFQCGNTPPCHASVPA